MTLLPTDISSAGVPDITVSDLTITSNQAPLYVTPGSAVISAWDSRSDGVAATAGGTAGTPGYASAQITGGTGTIQMAWYTGDPTGGLASGSMYLDIHLAPLSPATQVAVVDCKLPPGDALYFFNPTTHAYTKGSQETTDATTGCVTMLVTTSGTPSIIDLSGLIMGAGAGPTAAYTRSFHYHRLAHGTVVFRWRAVVTRGVVGFAIFHGVHRVGRRLIAVHPGREYVYRVKHAGHGPFGLRVLLVGGRWLAVTTAPG